jgi:hypothetical protein
MLTDDLSSLDSTGSGSTTFTPQEVTTSEKKKRKNPNNNYFEGIATQVRFL